VVYRRLEEHDGRRVRVVDGEVKCEFEDEVFVGCGGGPVDGGGPDGHVLVRGEGGDAGCGVQH
jgi:hypothetical protein